MRHSCVNHQARLIIILVVLGAVSWLDAADDEVLKSKFQEFYDWSENMARERGLLARFLYMNYALGTQDVIGSVGEDNLKRMREIQRAYDPDDVFGKYWKGGFKLHP